MALTRNELIKLIITDVEDLRNMYENLGLDQSMQITEDVISQLKLLESFENP